MAEQSPLSYDQAVALRDRGVITPATFDAYTKRYGSPQAPGAPAEPAATSVIPGALPAASGQPTGQEPMVRAPAPDPDEERKERQRQLFNEHKAGVAKMEVEGAERRALEAQADIENRRDIAARMGMSPDEVEKKLEPVKAHAAELQKDADAKRAGIVKTGGLASENGGTETAPAAGNPNVVLASDKRGGDSSGYIQGTSPQDALNQAMEPAMAGFNMQAAGIRAAAKAGSDKAAEEAAYLERIRKEDEDRIKTADANQAARQAKLDEAFQKLDQSANDLASKRVDPERYWANKTTGDKVMAGIGLFFGAFGQGGNKAVSVISDAIDRDINAQKSDIQTAKDVYTARQGIYSDMFATYKDRRVAEEASRAAYLENAQLEVKRIAAKYAGPETQAKAQMLLGELEQKKQAARAEFAKLVMGSMPVTADANPEALKPEQRERFVPGYGLALTKEDATKLKDHTAQAASTKGNLSRLLQIGAMGGKSSDLGLRNEAQTLVSILKGQLRTPVVGPGAVSESEWKLLDEIVADPTKLWSLDGSNRKRLETIMQYVDRQTASMVRSAGLTDVNSKLGFKTAGK